MTPTRGGAPACPRSLCRRVVIRGTRTAGDAAPGKVQAFSCDAGESGPAWPRSVLPDGLRQRRGPKRVRLRSLPHPPAANALGSRWGWGGRSVANTVSLPNGLCPRTLPCARGEGVGPNMVTMPPATGRGEEVEVGLGSSASPGALP
jgi:hypothetical protein